MGEIFEIIYQPESKVYTVFDSDGHLEQYTDETLPDTAKSFIEAAIAVDITLKVFKKII